MHYIVIYCYLYFLLFMFSRWYILGKDSATIFTNNRNCIESCNEECLVEPLNPPEEEVSLTEDVLQNIIPNNEDISDVPHEIIQSDYFVEPEYFSENVIEEIPEEYGNLLTTFKRFQLSQGIHEEGLKYLCGYVAYLSLSLQRQV